ncbi:MAG: hypothetical protein QG671_1494 [Actinomycetota bacterium]|nr:hypothetical protein [Actinomycetota bacterium]
MTDSQNLLTDVILQPCREVDLTTFPSVPLDVTTLRPGGLVRTGVPDDGRVVALAATAAHWAPVLVRRETLTVLDGDHRLAAARSRGDAEIEAVLVDSSDLDVFVLAVTMNVRYGPPLSRGERRAALTRILASHPDWSDRRIAVLVGVSPKTVRAVRGSSDEVCRSAVRVGADGRVRTLDVVEGRRRALEILTAWPDLPVRQVAQASGVSVGTVQDVRRRLLAGTGRVPERAASYRPARPAPVAPAAGRPEMPWTDRGTGLAPSTMGRADMAEILAQLRRDPSVRAREGCRTMLRLMSAHVSEAEGLERVAGAVPAHRRRAVSVLARECAQIWLRLAGETDAGETDVHGVNAEGVDACGARKPRSGAVTSAFLDL